MAHPRLSQLIKQKARHDRIGNLYGLEQLRSQDATLQSSAKRMIERMQAINEEQDQQRELVGQRDQEALVEELDTSSVRVHREADAL